MKTLWVLLCLELVAPRATAQLIRPALDEDPVFCQVVAKRLHFPRAFEYFPIYGRVYAGFRIDSTGRLINLVILSPGNTKSGFEYQVLDALKHIPPLKPSYEGDYTLPVAFCYRNRSVSDSLYIPVNRLDERLLGNRLLLAEKRLTFSFAPARSYPDPREVWGYYPKQSVTSKVSRN